MTSSSLIVYWFIWYLFIRNFGSFRRVPEEKDTIFAGKIQFHRLAYCNLNACTVVHIGKLKWRSIKLMRVLYYLVI